MPARVSVLELTAPMTACTRLTERKSVRTEYGIRPTHLL